MIAIIGAGPVGNYLAYLISKNGYNVNVYEEHKQIGTPVQCTGLTTNFLSKILPIRDEFVVNKIKIAKIISPNKNSVKIKLKPYNLVLDRTRFDNYLAKKARENGAKFCLNHKYLSTDRSYIRFLNKKSIKVSHLVGTDGPVSQVAKSCNLFTKRRFMLGIQARVKLKNSSDILEYYPINKGYAWMVPENNKIVRIGLANYKNTRKLFYSFLKKRAYKCKVLDYQAGLIPIYNPKIKTQTKAGNVKVHLLGDAATMVKATTGGGIIPGMIAAQQLIKSIKTGKDYQKLWKKKIGKDLHVHLLMRKILNKFSNKDYDKLIKLTSQDKIKSILSTKDREHASNIALKMILKEPKFLGFLRYFI